VIVPVSGENSYMFASGYQLAGDIFADKTGTAKYANGIVLHVKDV